MTQITINESSMTFGPFDEENIFYIEKVIQDHQLDNHVQISEFMILRNRQGTPDIWVVEAKSSAPNPGGKEKFKEYVCQIQNKFSNSLSMGISTILKRHVFSIDEFSTRYRNLDLEHVNFKFVLVIHDFQEEWLPPLNDAINKALIGTQKIWNLHSPCVIVLNDVMARRKNLIL